MVEGKLELRSEVLDPSSEISLGKRGELVEEWLDKGGVNDLQAELDADSTCQRGRMTGSQEEHEPRDKLLSCQLDDLQESSEQWESNHSEQHGRLDLIHYP